MKEVVKIIKVKVKGKKYLVYTDYTDEPYLMNEDQIVHFRIIKDATFYTGEFESIIDSLKDDVFFNKMLVYIDYKQRTKKEIIERLKELNASDQTIQVTVDRLIEKKYLDDDRYAKCFIEERVRHEYGPKSIKYDLITKGINEEIIYKYLPNDDELYYQNALNVANKTLKTLVGLPLNKQKESINSRLTRLGYDYSIIRKVIANLSFNEVDFDKLKLEIEKLKQKELDKNKLITKLLTKGYEYCDIKKMLNELD